MFSGIRFISCNIFLYDQVQIIIAFNRFLSIPESSNIRLIFITFVLASRINSMRRKLKHLYRRLEFKCIPTLSLVLPDSPWYRFYFWQQEISLQRFKFTKETSIFLQVAPVIQFIQKSLAVRYKPVWICPMSIYWIYLPHHRGFFGTKSIES